MARSSSLNLPGLFKMTSGMATLPISLNMTEVPRFSILDAIQPKQAGNNEGKYANIIGMLASELVLAP